ncbi:MAG TPA: hypothetical protein VKX28_11940 [Xanthobacteraceae bacterium]|nr:hypothetical protein [Xanthobacteraceae bacterium]
MRSQNRLGALVRHGLSASCAILVLLSVHAVAFAAEEGGLYGIDQERFDQCMSAPATRGDRARCLKWAGPSRAHLLPARDPHGRHYRYNPERYDYCVKHKLYGDRTDISAFCTRWSGVWR